MTPEETLEEIAQDVEWRKAECRGCAVRKMLDRIEKKYKKHLSVYFYRKRKTPRGNTMLFLFWLNRGSVKENWKEGKSSLFLMETGKERYMLAGSRHTILRFTPHFFKRYKERMILEGDPDIKALLGSAKDLLQVATVFCMRNMTRIIVFEKSDKDRYGMTESLCPVKDGVILCTETRKMTFIQANTFLTKGALNRMQRVRYDTAEKNMTNIHGFADKAFGTEDWRTDPDKAEAVMSLCELLRSDILNDFGQQDDKNDTDPGSRK